jgi:hypothetical protein
MVRKVSFALAIGLLAGCEAAIIGASSFLCLGMDLGTDIVAVPSDLRHVMDNREQFATTDHPLNGVDAGEVIDNVEASLDGCWGYFGTEPLSAADPQPVDVVAVYRFDTQRGLMQTQEVAGLERRVRLWDNQPAIFVWDREMTEIGANELQVDQIYYDGALLEDDGTIRSYCLTTVAAGISWPVPVKLTISGDAMVTFENYEGSEKQLTRRWRRFPCVTDEIELLRPR